MLKQWRSVLEYEGEDGFEVERNLAAELGSRLQTLLQENRVTTLSSHKVFEGLEIAELNGILSVLDADSLGSHRALISLNNIVHMAPSAVGAALAEHGTVEALTRLHSRVTMLHALSPVVMLVLHALCINCEELTGGSNVDVLATKQAVVELVVGAVIWLGNSPERLCSASGMAMANRAVQICWSISRHETPAANAVLALFRSVDLPGRALRLAACAGGALGIESLAMEAGGAASSATNSSSADKVLDDGHGRTLGELAVGLSAVCSSFAAATLGLGGALDASPAGLQNLRSWVLDREHLADVRCTLLALIDELHCTGPLLAHLREEAQQDQQAAAAAGAAAAATSVAPLEAVAGPAGAEDTAAAEAATVDGPPAPRRTAAETLSALQGSVEGALRNVLTSLAVPLLCADPGQASEVTALTVFALKYYYRIYQEGFADVFKLLAVRTSVYRGSYLPFYCALSELMLEGILIIGPQFAAWGVELDKSGASSAGGDEAELFVPTSGGEGPDAATAQAFISEQAKSCVGWSQRVWKLIQLSQRAALARQQEQANRASAAAGQTVEQPTASSAPTKCSFCANAISGVKKSCACGLASYCDKTCQVAHFPQHKGVCKARRQK